MKAVPAPAPAAVSDTHAQKTLAADPRAQEAARPRRLREEDHPPHPEYHEFKGKPVKLLKLHQRGIRGRAPGPYFEVQFPDGTKDFAAVPDLVIRGPDGKIIKRNR